jgi:hypothetical protein
MKLFGVNSNVAVNAQKQKGSRLHTIPPTCQPCPRANLGNALQLVAQRPVVAAFEPALFPLAFPRLDKVLETPRALNCRLAAFGAPFVSLHAQLILALPRDRQMRELVFYASSHVSVFPCPLPAHMLIDIPGSIHTQYYLDRLLPPVYPCQSIFCIKVKSPIVKTNATTSVTYIRIDLQVKKPMLRDSCRAPRKALLSRRIFSPKALNSYVPCPTVVEPPGLVPREPETQGKFWPRK